MGHLQFFLKIREHSQPPENHLSPPRMGIVHRQSFKVVYLYVGQMGHRFLNLFDAMFDRKQRGFIGVVRNNDNYPIK